MTSLRIRLLAVATVAMTSALASAEESDASSQQKGAPSFLFVQYSNSVDVSDHTITLVDANKRTIWLTDRPNRLVGKISNESFATLWDEGPNSFAIDPPNAVVTIGSHRPVIVTLTDISVVEDNISYQFERLSGHFPYRASHTTIVIDNASVDLAMCTVGSSLPWCPQ